MLRGLDSRIASLQKNYDAMAEDFRRIRISTDKIIRRASSIDALELADDTNQTSSEPVHRNIKTDYPESTLSVKFRIFAHKEVPELQLTTGVCRKLAVVAGAAGHHFKPLKSVHQRKISPLTPLAKRRFKLRYRFEKIYHPTVIRDLKYGAFPRLFYCNNHFRILHAC
ncbi:MAG: hypothetical protein Ct9H300mP14_08650 [Gammaproteobacteria bacterium]|nr:MAG: hypothetical protein Ct9H300mP14_08650 [Gammaproteobacteria bacterium]